MSRRSLSLRASVLALVAILTIVAFSEAAALVRLTATIGRDTARVSIADARMRASLRTKVALLWYARQSDLAVSRPTPEALADQSTAEAELLADIDETRRLATPDRAAQLDNLVLKSGSYISLRKELQRQGMPLDVILQRSTPALQEVFGDLQHIVAYDDAWSRSAQASARRGQSIAKVLAIVASGLLLLGLAAGIVVSDRLLRRPVLAVRNAITRFGRGEPTCRAPPAGTREIREIATDFNDLADRLVRQDKERLAFLASIAHDLRNPLSPLTLAIGKLRIGPKPPTPETYGKVVALVHRQLERLDRMVGDLLDATRIQSGQFELRPQAVDLQSLVAGVVDLLRPTSASHEIEIIGPDAPVVVYADPLRIEQVLINLVSNAVKYSPGGGRIVVRLSRTGSEAVIAVSDEGIGIPPEERERIFEPFHRTGRSKEVASGVGLGLSVSRKIAQAHGGSLEVASPGPGTTLRLGLPLGASGRREQDDGVGS